MPSKKAPKKPGFAMFKSDDPTIKQDSSPIVGNDASYNPCDDELLDDNTENKKFTNIIQCIINLCDSPSDSLMVEYITNNTWSILMDVTTIMVDKVDNFCIDKMDRLFEAKLMILHLCKLQCFLLFHNSKRCD
jgi:hypothetical protein